ncbi:MAG: hypothetical protein Q7R96_04330 [Nanoarchaeota archaeon]|nr:hypothetical protein [Nanoarchaeota archaeon]
MVKRTKKAQGKRVAKAEQKVAQEVVETAEPVYIKLRPGTSAEKSVRFLLPQEMLDQTVERIIAYGLGLTEKDGLKREELRVQERLRTEMRGQYGIAVNGNAMTRTSSIAEYLIDDMLPAPHHTKYRKADIIVAARQEGASLDYKL